MYVLRVYEEVTLTVWVGAGPMLNVPVKTPGYMRVATPEVVIQELPILQPKVLVIGGEAET